MPKIFKRLESEEKTGVTADINVTPLVDVTLVLLIIFMVITPLLQVGAPVQLPLTKEPASIKHESNQITISVSGDLTVWWENDLISRNLYNDTAKLDEKLKTTHSKNPGKQILIKGDKRVKYGEVRLVMKRVQEAGFVNIAMIVDKEK